jgi:glucose/arabinose dehydrogenase
MIKVLIIASLTVALNLNSYSQNIQLNKIKLPPGFKINIFASGIQTARSIAISHAGIVFAGSMSGKVYAIRDSNNDYIADEIFIIADNLKMPVGVALYKNDLYVSATSKILKYKNIEENLGKKITPVIINDSFPTDTHHGWKFIKFGPDDKLYVPVGAPCNVCLKNDKRYATIMRMNPDGTDLEIFASGIRNTVGFDWHPVTHQLWFTDNGRDLMGDNIPPDELNNAPVKEMHFGFPFIHGKNIIDPDFGKNINVEEFTKPSIELGPHVASLGMRFYTGKMFPDEYKNQIFIAEHGSWNRSIPIGYRITLVKLDGNKAISYEIFADGWLGADGKAWGRPVDVEIAHDGSLLVSDDRASVIYRIFYVK